MEKIKKHLFFITIFLVTTMFALMNSSADRDLWHRLAAGSIFSNLGHVLQYDVFSYTPVKSIWVDHEWLSGVVFYFMSHNFGDFGLLALKIAVLLSIILLIFKTHRLISDENNKYRILYYALTIIAIVPAFTTNVRSHVFTYLFFTLWIYLLEKVKRGENRLIWIFPATMTLWANLHGGFPAGIGLIGIYLVGEFLNKNNPAKYLGILLLTLCVTLINPYGIKLLTYLVSAVTMPRPYILEWYPLNLLGPVNEFLGFKTFFVMATFSLILMLKKERNWTEILLITVTLFLSLKHQRHIAFFSITSSIFCYKYFYSYIFLLKERFKSLSDKKLFKLSKFGIETAVYALLISISMSLILSSPFKIEVKEEEYPVKAVEFIKINSLKGNLLTSFNWGSYALWQLYPDNKVALDGRYEEIYTDETYMSVTDFIFAKNDWMKPLKSYRNDIVLVPTNCETFKRLMNLNTWKVIYKDKFASVLVPSNLPVKRYVLPIDKDYSKTKFAVPLNQTFIH